MVHFLVQTFTPGEERLGYVRHFQHIGTFTSSLFWVLMSDGFYMVATGFMEAVFLYDYESKELYRNKKRIAKNVTIQQAEEIVLADICSKKSGIYRYYTASAKDIISEIFVV